MNKELLLSSGVNSHEKKQLSCQYTLIYLNPPQANVIGNAQNLDLGYYTEYLTTIHQTITHLNIIKTYNNIFRVHFTVTSRVLLQVVTSSVTTNTIQRRSTDVALNTLANNSGHSQELYIQDSEGLPATSTVTSYTLLFYCV